MHQRKALAVLLLEAGRTVSVQQLIDALWEGEPPATARRQVQNTVAALRRSMGAADPIVRSGDGYQVNTDALDWQDFRAEVAKAKVALDPEASFALLHQALQRWQGPVLAGLECRAIDAAVARMEQERLSAFEDYVDAALALGIHEQVLGELRALAAGHPFRPRLTGQLMLALYRSGDGAGALGVYNDLGEHLGEELGIEPDRRLRDLYVAILREDPSLDPRPQPSPTTTPPDTGTLPPAPNAVPALPAVTGPTRRPWARPLALALTALLILLTSVHNRPEVSAPLDPLWTLPAQEAGAAVMRVDTGFLIWDTSGIRLEVDGEVIWSMPVHQSTVADVFVTDDTIVLASHAPGESPQDGFLSVIDLQTGADLWWDRDRRPAIVDGDTLISVRCQPPHDDPPDQCTLESTLLRSATPQWSVPIEAGTFPVAAESGPYDNPWGPSTIPDLLTLQPSGYRDSTGFRFTVHDAATGEVINTFTLPSARVWLNEGMLIVFEGGSLVLQGPCPTKTWAYEVYSGEERWYQVDHFTSDRDGYCRSLPLQGTDNRLATVESGTASVVDLQSGETEWTVPDPSTPLLLTGDMLVAAHPKTGSITVWDVEKHEQRWTTDMGELIGARGSTLWVLDQSAIDPDCGGLIGYNLATGDNHCLPGTLQYLTDTEVVTADDGTWNAWPADPWSHPVP
ncbi:AfsR/SARP family transcriptional regulator [Glycomyces sp. NPDC047010]|uniref:AfsR/SARP family transcriptional regulator n=1 Tax=Glycomyces sp. NPDC047010 TaxID=3155023 RepID=UPI0034034FFA